MLTRESGGLWLYCKDGKNLMLCSCQYPVLYLEINNVLSYIINIFLSLQKVTLFIIFIIISRVLCFMSQLNLFMLFRYNYKTPNSHLHE